MIHLELDNANNIAQCNINVLPNILNSDQTAPQIIARCAEEARTANLVMLSAMYDTILQLWEGQITAIQKKEIKQGLIAIACGTVDEKLFDEFRKQTSKPKK